MDEPDFKYWKVSNPDGKKSVKQVWFNRPDQKSCLRRVLIFKPQILRALTGKEAGGKS